VTTTMDGETQVPGSAPAERLRVLLVDDNASVLRFLASAFASNGCQVTTAATAEQALEQLSDDPYDLVVSDIKMPGLSGLDLLRAVKGKQPGTPVVLITGVPSVNSAVFGLRHGAYDYLPKPFSVTEVKELIRRLRRDRADGNGNVNYPAGLTEELARRQGGVEAISRIGEVALQGLEPSVFAEKVVEYTMQSLRCDGALMLLRDQGGQFNASRKGEP
jgi:DNA-binding NtrC family response regulator